jgi:hypothetical protein
MDGFYFLNVQILELLTVSALILSSSLPHLILLVRYVGRIHVYVVIMIHALMVRQIIQTVHALGLIATMADAIQVLHIMMNVLVLA